MKVIRLLSEKGARTYRFMKIVSRSAVVILSEPAVEAKDLCFRNERDASPSLALRA